MSNYKKMTYMISRIIYNKIIDNPKSILLLGPRQVGKSSLCKILNPDLIINLADQEQFNQHLKDPGYIKRLAEVDQNKLIVVDEVQRIPDILNSIQYLIDNYPDKRFLITGSSARKLKKGNANLLPGRIIVMHLPPLVFWEVAEKFDLKKALTRGMLPEIYLNENLDQLLYSYTNTYLREEIQAEALTKNLGAYSRFLDVAALKSGEQVNYSKLSSDCEINKETLRRYFSILEDTLLIEKIPSFIDIIGKRRAQQKEKFIFFDLGVRNAILKIVENNFTNTELGFIFEQWFILQCIYYNRLMFKNWKISTFRTDQGDEVDLIIETPDKIFAIEIKYSNKLSEKMCNGLNFFGQVVKAKKVQKYLIYIGDETQIFAKNITAINFQRFLSDIIKYI